MIYSKNCFQLNRMSVRGVAREHTVRFQEGDVTAGDVGAWTSGQNVLWSVDEKILYISRIAGGSCRWNRCGEGGDR